MDRNALFAALGLSNGPRRVLVVEDDRSWYEALTELLASNGHTVVAGAGASPAGPGSVLLHGFLGEAEGPFDLSGFEAAFLDHYFPGVHDGRTLAMALRAASPTVRILGMSSSEAANGEMVRYGADLGIRKAELRRLLR